MFFVFQVGSEGNCDSNGRVCVSSVQGDSSRQVTLCQTRRVGCVLIIKESRKPLRFIAQGKYISCVYRRQLNLKDTFVALLTYDKDLDKCIPKGLLYKWQVHCLQLLLYN